MAGTKEGGRRAAETNKLRHGKDFFKKIGAKGGRNGRTGGFGSSKVGKDGLTGPQRARLVGVIGGLCSSRKGKKNKNRQESEAE